MRILLPVSRRRARLEIIPLIDIIFFLLATFVMVSLSMVKNRGIPVHLPAASTAARQDRTRYVAVTVTESGDLYLDKQRLGLREISAQLSRLKGKEPDLKVFIQGDERAGFGTAIRVLDEVRALGITKVFIQTKPRSDSRNVS